MTGRSDLHLPAGSTAQGPFDVVVTPESAGWGYSSLRVLDLAPGQEVAFGTADSEVVVVPLHGGVRVVLDGRQHDGGGRDGGQHDGTRYDLAGRAGPFAGPTDVLYLPQGTAASLTSERGARVALPGARVPVDAARLPVRHVPAADVPVELRGAGSCSRQVQGFSGCRCGTCRPPTCPWSCAGRAAAAARCRVSPARTPTTRTR